MSERLKDEVIAITGGGAGIGLAVAKSALREGARVVLIDLDKKLAEKSAAELDSAKACGFGADVTKEDEVAAAIKAAQKKIGPVTGLVNNAGIAGFGSVHDADTDMWDRIMAVNVTGTFLASKAVLPSMLKNGGGSIVNFGSVAGMVGIPTMAAYCAAKGAIINLTRQMAADYASKGVRVNAVCPGTVATTGMGQQLLGSDNSPEVQARRLAKYPMGRFGTPEDIAEAVIFLLSDDAAFVTGSAFVVDGGMTAI